MHTRILLTALFAAAFATPAGAQIWNRNLILNPGAEAGAATTSRDQPPVKDVPNWTTSGSFTVGPYESGDGYFGLGDYGPIDRGAKYFLGGPGGGKATAVQSISLAAGAAEIDAGRVRFYLAGYLGRYSQAENTLSSLKAVFKDSSGRTLLESTVGGPSQVEAWGLPNRAASGFLLPNTRSVEIQLDLSSPVTGWNDCGADNLSLTLALEAVTGVNLVVNGDGEASGAADGRIGDQMPMPGWSAYTTPPYIVSISYAEARIPSDGPGPPKREHVFYGNSGSELRMRQPIDVTLARDLIDGGGVGFQLSAWLGGEETDSALPSVTVEFLDASGRTLSSRTAGPATQSDRGGKTGLVKKQEEGSVPAGTRTVRVGMAFTGIAPTGTPVFADEISLILTSGAAGVNLGAIANAASGAAGAIAPGEMVNLATTGVNLSSVVRLQLTSDGKLSRELGGVKAFFDGTQAPLLYVTSSQVGAIVPFDLEGKTSTRVRIEYQGVKSTEVTQSVARTAPGIFTQEGTPRGAGEIYNGGAVLNSRANPAAAGSTVTIIWTGGGQTNPGGTDGRMETGALPSPAQTVEVKIGGKPAELVFAGAVPYAWAGLLQAQVKVPSGLSAAEAVPVVITAGGVSSLDNAVTMWVK